MAPIVEIAGLSKRFGLTFRLDTGGRNETALDLQGIERGVTPVCRAIGPQNRDLGPVETRDNGASHDPILVLLR